MTLHTVDPLHDERWTTFVEGHARSSIFHTRNWLRALQRTYGYDPVVFTTAPPGAPLRDGLLFCRVRSWLTGSRLVSLPFSDHCEPLVDSASTLREMIDSARQTLAGEGRYVELRPLTAIAAGGGLEASADYCLHSIDLRADLETVFGRFHHSHVQRSVRKAERSGVEVVVGRTSSLLNAFYDLHTMTRRRQVVPVQPLSWFRNVIDSLGEMVTVYVATYEGRPVASILTALHKRTLVYKYGCSNADYKRVGATSLLFWRAIQGAKSRDAEEVDLGRTDLDNAGLLAFKDHLGGTRQALTYYRLPLRVSRIESRTPSLAKRVYAVVPRAIQMSLGRALYRHFA